MEEGLPACESETQRAFFLNPVHGLYAAPESFCHISAAEKGKADNTAGFRVGFDADLRQAVVDEEKLYKQRRIPAQLHIGGGDPAKHRDAPVKHGGGKKTHQGSEQDARCACPQGKPGGFSIERQDFSDIRPIHGTASSFLSGTVTGSFNEKPGSRLKAPGQI